MSRIWMINHYASTPTTGMAGRMHYLARELSRLGHDVTVVGARSHHLLRDEVDKSALPYVECIDGYRLIRLDVPRYSNSHDTRRVFAWIVFAGRLLGLRRRLGQRPDVVLYSSPQLIGYLCAERLARTCGARLVFDVRDIWPLTLLEIGGYSPQHPFIRFLQWIEDRAYARADRVVSNLEGAVVHMMMRGMESKKFAWVSNGIARDEIIFNEPLPPAVAAQIPSNGFRVVYTGTLGTANALDTLIEAAALLRDLPDVKILLVGQGQARAKLEEKRNEMGLNNVWFIGSVPKAQVQSVLAACHVCYIGLSNCSLLKFGVAPNKLFDYFLSGRPIIYGINSGDFNPVKRYGAGITIPAENPQELADAIRQLYAMTSDERRVMGENGRMAALEHYDYSMLAKRLERVLLD